MGGPASDWDERPGRGRGQELGGRAVCLPAVDRGVVGDQLHAHLPQHERLHYRLVFHLTSFIIVCKTDNKSLNHRLHAHLPRRRSHARTRLGRGARRGPA